MPVMKLAIMQPYFFPYLGYWQLFHYADAFMVFDGTVMTGASLMGSTTICAVRATVL